MYSLGFFIQYKSLLPHTSCEKHAIRTQNNGLSYGINNIFFRTLWVFKVLLLIPLEQELARLFNQPPSIWNSTWTAIFVRVDVELFSQWTSKDYFGGENLQILLQSVINSTTAIIYIKTLENRFSWNDGGQSKIISLLWNNSNMLLWTYKCINSF